MKKASIVLEAIIIWTFLTVPIWAAQPGVEKKNDATVDIRICFQDVDWPPYTFGPNSNFNGKGALPDLLTYIEKDIDVILNFMRFHGKGAKKSLRQMKWMGHWKQAFEKRD